MKYKKIRVDELEKGDLAFFYLALKNGEKIQLSLVLEIVQNIEQDMIDITFLTSAGVTETLRFQQDLSLTIADKL